MAERMPLSAAGWVRLAAGCRCYRDETPGRDLVRVPGEHWPACPAWVALPAQVAEIWPAEPPMSAEEEEMMLW